ncbi:hypothetical protein D3C71_1710820 [compost metagenome]
MIIGISGVAAVAQLLKIPVLILKNDFLHKQGQTDDQNGKFSRRPQISAGQIPNGGKSNLQSSHQNQHCKYDRQHRLAVLIGVPRIQSPLSVTLGASLPGKNLRQLRRGIRSGV